MIGVGFGDAGGDGAHSGLGHQFDADADAGVDVFEVVDQLRQVFDGVDVVVRRRRSPAFAPCSFTRRTRRPGDKSILCFYELKRIFCSVASKTPFSQSSTNVMLG